MLLRQVEVRLRHLLREQQPIVLEPAGLAHTVRSMGFDYLVLVAAVGIFILSWRASGRAAAGNEAVGLFVGLVRYYLLITLFHVFGRSVWQTRHRIEWGF